MARHLQYVFVDFMNITFNPLDILLLTQLESVDLTQPTNMIKTTDLSDAQLDALIHHYKRIRERIADNATAMTRLESLVAEKTDRITKIINDEVGYASGSLARLTK